MFGKNLAFLPQTQDNIFQCCRSGCLSRIRIFSIPDPGSASKNLSILTQKMVSKLSEIWSGCSSRIRILALLNLRQLLRVIFWTARFCLSLLLLNMVWIRLRIQFRNRNRNFSKVGTGTVITRDGSTTLVKQIYSLHEWVSLFLGSVGQTRCCEVRQGQLQGWRSPKKNTAKKVLRISFWTRDRKKQPAGWTFEYSGCHIFWENIRGSLE
jgi:hypothetical protein